ncbi:MAG: GAF domain-containing sensor histidine kinase, partial [Chloroflexi bacterium]|nr:GAF domain-containing sensor histidine kinase [Chloroflexota bacterium]
KAGSVSEMLPVFLEKAIEVVGGRSGIIFLLEPESGELVARDCLPRDPNSLGMRHRPGEGITGRVAATGRIHVTEDVNEVSLVGLLPGEAKRFSMSRSAISLPLITQEQNVGVMHLELPEPHKFSEEEVRLLTAMAEMAGSALHRAGILETLEQRVAERTRELAGANQRLQELDRLKSQFVSNVTHELRAPVSNMILYLDLLAHGQPERREKYQAVLQEQASRLGQLIEDILNLSRLETGQEKAGLAPVSLSEVVEQVVITHLPRAEKARLALNYKLDPDVPLVEGERSQLARVVTNLVANAINYTLRGSIEVRLIYDPERGEARLEVEDTGIGIDAEDWPYLFDRFYRGQRARQMDIPGTGLGLGIVKEIVELHGGRIEFQSEVDVGTTFCVFFPVILFSLPAAESFVAAD